MLNLALLLLLLFGYLLVGAGLGIAGFVAGRRRDADAAAMRRQIGALSEAVDRLRREIAAPPQAAQEAGGGETPIPVPAVPLAEPTPAQIPTEAEPPMPAEAAPSSPGAADIGAAAQPGFSNFEERVASRWILWVGGLALALGGAFLVKYAADEGWLGPAARVGLGFAFGSILTMAGEWLRQRPLERAIAALRTDYLPPALTAAGLFIAFASIYAAFALYDLIAPITAFGLMAAVAASAVFLALLQGPFTALLGIVGGFATPLLVPSDQPLAWGLFAYLLFIGGSAMVVVRYTAARWLSWITLAGALLWPALWLGAMWRPGDGAAVGLYLLLSLAIYLFVPARQPIEPPPQAQPLPRVPDLAVLDVWLAVAGTALLVFALLRTDSYGSAALLTLAGFVGLSLLAGRRLAGFDAIPLAAELLTLAAMAAWHLPLIVTTNSPFYRYPQGYLAGPVVPPELTLFLSTTLGFALLLGGGAYWLLWRARRPGWWAAVSASAPVLLLALAYWRIAAFGVDLQWSAAALVLAGIEVAAASRLGPYRARAEINLSLAAYAAAAVAAIGLGMAMALREAWLTVALAIELPALAWIADRLRVSPLRPIATAVAAIVLVRLAANPNVVEYRLGGVPGLNWMLYGYGIPAAAFFAAANRFRRATDDYLVTMLELGAIAFAALLVTGEIHNLLAGPLNHPRQGLLETSLQSTAWLALAIGLAASGRWSMRRAGIWARQVLAGLAVLQIVLSHLLLDNPLWSGEAVGTAPLFNVLFLAYGGPAALVMIYVWVAAAKPVLAKGAGLLALILVFVEVSLEVCHGFHGPVLSGGSTSDAEWYGYSAAWLGYAGALLALGIASRSQALRYASLAVLLVAVGKVFLSDMGDLTGLYRVASFVGLGLCLIAAGYFYQRFVFRLPPRRPA